MAERRPFLLSRQPAKCTQNRHIFHYSTQTVHRRSTIFNIYIRHNMSLNISDGFFSHIFHFCVSPPGASNCQKMLKTKKIKITSSQFIIYLHNELQSCRGSCKPWVCKISGISIVAFCHQGSLNCQKMRKTSKIKLTSSLFIIYLHNELQTCRGSCNPWVCKISGNSIFAFDHQGSSNCQKMQKQGKSKKNQTNIFHIHNLLT